MPPRIQEIELDNVQSDPEQPRRYFGEEELRLLANTIRSRGQRFPALVRPDPRGTGFILVDGERRYRALRLLQQSDPKFSKITAIVDTDQLSSTDRRIVQYLANEQREGHTPLERIALIEALEQDGLTSETILDSLGMNPGEYRLLSKLRRAEPWLLDFGRPDLKIPVPVLDEDGHPKRGTNGRPVKNYTRAVSPLRLTHLDLLVTAANKLRKIDEQQAATTGKLLNLARKEVTKLAHAALAEEWSARTLDGRAKRICKLVSKRFEPPETSVSIPKETPGPFPIGRLKALPRARQIASLQQAIAELGLTLDDLRQ